MKKCEWCGRRACRYGKPCAVMFLATWHNSLKKAQQRNDWTPFDRKGNLNVTFFSDRWWKRLWAKLTGKLLWHRSGAVTSQDMWQPETPNPGGSPIVFGDSSE